MWRIKLFILTHTHKSSFMAHIRVSDEFVPLWESLNYFSSQLTSLITYNLIKFTMRLGKRSISLIANKLIGSLARLESPALGSRLKGCPRQANNRREQHIHQGCLNGGCLLGTQIITYQDISKLHWGQLHHPEVIYLYLVVLFLTCNLDGFNVGWNDLSNLREAPNHYSVWR